MCNTRVHAETGQTPVARFTSQEPLQAVEPSVLREAFRWSVVRRVTSTASVSLAGNRYAVDQTLIGRRVELRFDPEDLTRLGVFWEGRPVGQAIPFIIGRHLHRQVPQAQPPTPPPSSGVDYRSRRRLPITWGVGRGDMPDALSALIRLFSIQWNGLLVASLVVFAVGGQMHTLVADV